MLNKTFLSILTDCNRKEGNVLFNDALNTFYLRLYGVIHIAREETRCCHMGYSFRLAARVLLYSSSHRQDNTYHGLCYTSRGALAGTRNSSMGPPHEGSIQWPIAPWANALTTELHLAPTVTGTRVHWIYSQQRLPCLGVSVEHGLGSMTRGQVLDSDTLQWNKTHSVGCRTIIISTCILY